MQDMKVTIARLNELYHKSRQQPLSPAELAERDQLRREYLGMIRNQVQASLDRIEIVEPEQAPECDCGGHHYDGQCNHPGHRH